MPNNNFLQSDAWEKFQQSVGFKTFRVDGAFLIKKPLGFGKSYFYCPRRGTSDGGRATRDFFNEVAKLAEEENCIFIRTEPLIALPVTRYPLRKVADVQPSQTLVLDLTLSEDELLTQMHPKTRYNIRLAEKKGVTVQEGKEDNFGKFWKLMQETTSRDKFRPHSREYYEKMINVVDEQNPTTPSPPPHQRRGNESKKFNVKLYVAEYENKILAAGIFVFYNDTVTYLHGASTHEHKEIMAPYALHWEIIKLAKNSGYRYYNLYGISEKKWPGVTRFKRGFGGEEVKYPGCYDVIFNKSWYGIYKFARYLRKLI